MSKPWFVPVLKWIVALMMAGTGVANAGTALSCAADKGSVVFNEFYTGSGTFVELYFTAQTSINGWGLFIVASNGNSFSVAATLGTGAGTAYVPGVTGTVLDSASVLGLPAKTFPAGTYITYDVSSPNAKAEFLLANVSTTGAVTANASVVEDYFYYNSSTAASFWDVPTTCGQTLLTHATSSKDISRATDGSGGWVDNGNTTTQGTSNNPGGTIHHIRLLHDGIGITCQPETVTIKACADALCTSLYTGGTTTVTLAGTGWSLPTNPATFTGSTTISLSVTTAQTRTLAVTSSSPTATAAYQCQNTSTLSTSCDINFSDSTFLISAVPTQLAGVTSGNITVRAVEKNTTTGACQGKFNGPVDIEVNARCINPTTCAGKSMVIGCTGACTSTAVSTTDNAATSTYTTVQKVNFGGTSTATLTVNYPDVGQMDFTLRYSLGGGQYMTGTSNAFVVMPYDYTVTNIKRTSDNVANPAAASASGTKFVQAGDGTTSTNQFTATVTAIASGGAATPNFGKEISQEGIKLTSARISDADLVSNGTFYVGSSASGQIAQLNLFSGGAATRTNLAWSEVGIMTLTPSIADGDYLGAGDRSGTASGNIGRFYPAQFTQVSGSVTAACAGGGFTYMGQKFTLASTLEARNSLASKTLNYNGTYAKSTVSYAAENADNGTDLMSRLGVSPGGSWLQGTFTLSGSTSTFSRPASPDGPFDSLLLGVKVTDPDGPVLSSLDMNPAAVGSAAPTHRLISGTATKMRFGRMRLSNAIGSELLRARVEYRAEYWDGSRWLTNTIDTCSGIAANNVAITTAGPAVYGTPTFNNGVGFITFNTPGSAGSYSYDIAVNLGATSGDASCNAAGFPAATAGANMPWLRGYWSGSCGGIAAWAQDPSARIKLGSPKAPYIYLRERY